MKPSKIDYCLLAVMFAATVYLVDWFLTELTL